MSQVKIAVALGSNLGDRKKKLDEAREVLSSDLFEVSGLLVSEIVESEPWGIEDQPKYLNQVMYGTTQWCPVTVLQFLKKTEKELGRTENGHWGARVIDLDLLVYGSEIVNEPQLKVPHPHLMHRDFVLFPFISWCPGSSYPGLSLNYQQVWDKLMRDQNLKLTYRKYLENETNSTDDRRY